MSFDSMRYLLHARGQFLPREHTLWDGVEDKYGTLKWVAEAVGRIRQLEVRCSSFPKGTVFMADVVLDGKFLMQVPDYAIPHVHRIFRDYLGMPNNYRNISNLKKEIAGVIMSLRENNLVAWPAPEPIFQIPKNAIISTEGENKMVIPEIKKVIYSGSKTIIIWADDTKTITSCAEGEQYDEYYGFCSAVVKKLFGSTSAAKKAIKKVRVENKNKKGDVNGCKNSCV